MTAWNMRKSPGSGFARHDQGNSFGLGATLLIVDDQPLVAEYMANAAEDWGWVATAACTADEVEAQLNVAHPQAIALDLDMPGKDGVEFLRSLSAHGYRGGVFIISACDQSVVETSARLGEQLGLNIIGYAQKPVTSDDFAALLERTVQSKH